MTLVRTLVWQSVLFVACYEPCRQCRAAVYLLAYRCSLAAGTRIPTPVCALVRNDTFGSFAHSGDGVGVATVRNGQDRSLQRVSAHTYDGEKNIPDRAPC